ncbi:MAG TPA: hypothetical protein VEY88_08115 [Archangium sp.]|nr:hypothetical protein [Archangium sp.]
MNWMTPWMLLAGACLVSGCSVPCAGYDADQPYVPTKVVEGSGRLVLSCANQTSRTLLLSGDSQYDTVQYLGEFHHNLEVILVFAPPGAKSPSVTLAMVIPADQQDGSHRLSPDSQSLHLSSEDMSLDFTLPTHYQGTLSFQRSRPVPLADDKEPAPGPYHYTFDGTLELEGQMPAKVWPECTGPIAFKLEPVTFHMEQNTFITTCSLSDVRGGGH